MPQQVESKYRELEQDIKQMKEDFARPLQEEVIVTPLMDVVARIMNLPDVLQGLEPRDIDRIRREVKECQRELEAISCEYINRIISKPNPSKVFRVVANAALFEARLKKHVGKKIKMEDGTEMQLTPAIVKALTRYRFSIGTPPVTPKGIDTIERILFAGTLKDIYSFREILGGDRYTFDRLVAEISNMVEQSAHYTTAGEKSAFEREATEFPNLEGLRGFLKTTVTGTPKTACRLISEQLFSKHSSGARPVKIVKKDGLDDALIAEMRRNKELIFVVPVSRIPHDIFTDAKLKSQWAGLIGRLVLVDDSQYAARSGTTLVYSINKDITNTLSTLHVKDSGTPANTQMNLRKMMENFRSSDLNALRANVAAQLEKLKAQAKQPGTAVRKQEWVVEAQKDYLALRKFKEFLDFLVTLKDGDEVAFKAAQDKLLKLTTDKTMRYFFKELKDAGYKGTVVPQGGGRLEIGHVGNYFLSRAKGKAEEFKRTKLESYRQKLAHLKASRQQYSSSDPEAMALQRSTGLMTSSESAIRNMEGGVENSRLFMQAKQFVISRVHKALKTTEGGVESMEDKLRALLSRNIPGELRAKVEKKLEEMGIGSLGKQMERDKFRQAGNLYRQVAGTLYRELDTLLREADDVLASQERGMETRSLELVEAMLNDIEKGSWAPSLAMPTVGWTFNDVMDEDKFPPKNYIKMPIGADGQMQPEALEAHLESVKEQLMPHFPDLFDLYCSKILIVFNDPHNPTAKVARNEMKLRLLDVASRYNIDVLADAAYHKQVKKSIKTEQGDYTLAEFYEMHKSRFPNPIRIHTSLPTTKWSVGGGKRTGAVVSNDPELIEYSKQNIDGVNTVSLYMDNAELDVGIMAKVVCKKLETTILWDDPCGTIDEILDTEFADLDSESFAAPVYFALMQARNDIERLRIRGASEMDYRKYMSNFISDLKSLRLDKLTARDNVSRSKAVTEAINEMEKKYPGIKERCILPEGPFYFLVKLDNGPKDPDLQQFLEKIAQARLIDVISTEDGKVRFSFGGLLDGSAEGYKVLSEAIQVNLGILIEYWEKFKEVRAKFAKEKDPNSATSALKELFPGGEIEFARTITEKDALIKRLATYKEKERAQVAFGIPENVARYVSKIEPGNIAHIVTLSGIDCSNEQELADSKTFRDLFDYYLTIVKNKIPELQHLSDEDAIAQFGGRQLAERLRTRMFDDTTQQEIFIALTKAIAEFWFGPKTMKFLARKNGGDMKKGEIFGEESKLRTHIKLIMTGIGIPEEDVPKKQTFQAGYKDVEGVKPAPGLPAWLSTLISKGHFATKTAQTELSPSMTTEGKARVPGFDRGIFRRDGDGENAPTSEYFSERLGSFMETANPNDYVSKLIQIGGAKVLLVLHKSYSHYLVEELRLFPQYDIVEGEMDSCKPDAVSFLGLPTKVMGENYKIGYFFDHDESGKSIPVTWVDGENVTDYMGYLKKPTLTAHNEIVKENGGLPIHGSAFIIKYRNGLRKTVVVAGDSGTGKSETLIAMVEQIVKGEGAAGEVEEIEMLAGDMLSLFTGEDGQIYMFGTEQGDFMRMDDIPEDWQKRYADRVLAGSKTNMDNDANKRITIGSLCDPKRFLSPTRVNTFLITNNFEAPNGSSIREIEDPRNLLAEWVRGYRGEKGTSGDQPNIYASLSFDKKHDNSEVLRKYGEELDRLLGWEVQVNDAGKAKNAILKFNDVEGEAFKAHDMVKEIFVGQKVAIDGKKAEIQDATYDVHKNRYSVVLGYENGETQTVPLDREGIFIKLFEPVASTYEGNPFVDPRGMKEVTERFLEAMKNAGVITGMIYTQLKVKGREELGPGDAARDLMELFLKDPRVNERFQNNLRTVTQGLVDKYGEMLNKGDLPPELVSHNLLLLELHQSHSIRLVDKDGKTIDIKTPEYQYRPEEGRKPFQPSLLHPDMKKAISSILENEEHARINLDHFQVTNAEITAYRAQIKAWDSKEELIYQILIVNGLMQLGYEPSVIERKPMIHEVKKAQKIAEIMMGEMQG